MCVISDGWSVWEKTCNTSSVWWYLCVYTAWASAVSRLVSRGGVTRPQTTLARGILHTCWESAEVGPKAAQPHPPLSEAESFTKMWKQSQQQNYARVSTSCVGVTAGSSHRRIQRTGGADLTPRTRLLTRRSSDYPSQTCPCHLFSCAAVFSYGSFAVFVATANNAIE